jgi:hypothetical protein
MTQGKLDEEIAQELVLTEVTIRTHISRILLKLGLENRVQAALYGLRSGMVSVLDWFPSLKHLSYPMPIADKWMPTIGLYYCHFPGLQAPANSYHSVSMKGEPHDIRSC